MTLAAVVYRKRFRVEAGAEKCTRPRTRMLIRQPTSRAAKKCARQCFGNLPVVIFRSFFPDLSGVLSSGNHRVHRERRVVPFSPEQFFNVVADVDSYKTFVPFCVDSKVVRRIDQCTMDADMSVGFKLFTEKYTSRVVVRRPSEVAVKALNSRLFSSLDSTWRFRPGKAPNTTLVDFSVEFEVKNVLAAQALDAFFDEVALQQVKAFERRCRQVYGPSVGGGAKRQRVGVGFTSAGGSTSPSGTVGFLFPVKDALAVESSVRVVRDAYQRQLAAADKETQAGGLTAEQFQAACKELSNEKGFRNFKELAEDNGMSAAVYSSLKYLLRRRLNRGLTSLRGVAGDEARACLANSTRGVPLGGLLDFSISVYMVVQASAEDRARYIFSILDTDGNKQLERDELQAALLLYMKSIAKVIPTVVAHQLKGMGHNLVDSDQVREEMVAVVDELMHQVTADIPRAVDQIFDGMDVDEGGCISEEQWAGAWQNFPELLDMMSLRGLGKTTHWAAIVLDQVFAGATQQQRSRGEPPEGGSDGGGGCGGGGQ